MLFLLEAPTETAAALGLLFGPLPAALLLRTQLLLGLTPALVLLALLRRGFLGLAGGSLLALAPLRVELLLDARLLGLPLGCFPGLDLAALGRFLCLDRAELGLFRLALGGLSRLDLAALRGFLLLGLATLRVLLRRRFVALALLLGRLRLLPLLLGTSLLGFLFLATAPTHIAA